MPRPAVLEVIDWQKVLASSKTYADWLKEAEFEMNASAMEDARKGQELTATDKERLGAIKSTVYVLAFAEDWCGDVVRHVPVLEKMADFSPMIVTRYLSRADAPELFARFLTNGGEAVPKFVCISASYVECGNWGPMPAAARELIARGKACSDVASARMLVAQGYKEDAQKREVVEELLHLFEIASTTEVASNSN